MQYKTYSKSRCANDPNKRLDILKVISDLPPSQCMTLLSHFYGGLSVEEIATVMKIPAELTGDYLEIACDRVLRELEVADIDMNISDEASIKIMLKEIFDWYETEVITDERIQRVLEPILQMIKDGKFDQPLLFRELGQ